MDIFTTFTLLKWMNHQDKITAQELVGYQADNAGLVEGDVIIEWLVINYAMKDRNPMDYVRFFSKHHQDQGIEDNS